MLDDFFTRALVAGIGIAMTAGPLGCFIIWRRMAYFGDTMAHSALLGVALSLLLDINLIVAVFAVASLVAVLLLLLQRSGTLSADSLLGILSHASLSVGLVLLAFMTWVRVDLVSFLFGDILAVSRSDIDVIWGGGVLVLMALVYLWRPLITSLLIIPAATARRWSGSPEVMAILSAVVGAVAVVGGLFGSLRFDTPSGPSIVVAALAIFVVSLLPLGRLIRPLPEGGLR
jgi:zinc transport system permease protein